ncbi:MAG TPA: hypothetical protein VKG43_09950 [Acidimicrobiales bacterium]|nr:hypothetical protein [Acidimicrobiales bacterium]
MNRSVVGVVALSIGALAVAGCGSRPAAPATGTPLTAAPPGGHTLTTPVPPYTTTTPPLPLVSDEGVGSRSTRSFMVSSRRWHVDVDVDCSPGRGRTTLTLHESQPSTHTDVLADQLAVTSGETIERSGAGTYVLTVTTGPACSWNVQVHDGR